MAIGEPKTASGRGNDGVGARLVVVLELDETLRTGRSDELGQGPPSQGQVKAEAGVPMAASGTSRVAAMAEARESRDRSFMADNRNA